MEIKLVVHTLQAQYFDKLELICIDIFLNIILESSLIIYDNIGLRIVDTSLGIIVATNRI
jgi:hypothetical protein